MIGTSYTFPPLARGIDRWRRNQTLYRFPWVNLIDSVTTIYIWVPIEFCCDVELWSFSLDTNRNSQALQHNVSICRFSCGLQIGRRLLFGLQPLGLASRLYVDAYVRHPTGPALSTTLLPSFYRQIIICCIWVLKVSMAILGVNCLFLGRGRS